MKRTINSHIQIPRFILENFEDSKHFLYQLDVRDLTIRGGHARTLNTQVGYYSNETEALLTQYYESPFAPILKKLKDFDFSTNTFQVSSDFSDFVKQFFGIIFARSPNMYSAISKNSIFMQIGKIAAEDKPDVAVRSAMLTDCRDVFRDYAIGFVSNQSKVPFVLPMCSAYGMRLHNKGSIFFPVAPNFAIVFVPRSVASLLVTNGTMPVLLLSEDAKARRMNLRALQSQQSQNYHDSLGFGWVVCNNKETLTMLVEDYYAISTE